ncbi:MAG: DJ-1/PfpI family protein [Deltaproteobacteria bacterium]|jgi:4-methyl-5(b-hydroxyethyl)-thiazole monophosphate biosynthesis|nr:DJ-1/PfpI family protein [Deltaproteobacteria bacterium]
MPKVAVFIINGFEEIEGTTTIDILRRGNVTVDIVSLEPDLQVTGAQKMQIIANKLLKDIDPKDYDMLIVPGGTTAYLGNKSFMDLLAAEGKAGKKLAAICVAPTVLASVGLLKGKKATSYPGTEDKLEGATFVTDLVVTDGNITTSRGPATTPLFALEILRILCGQEVSDGVKKGILLPLLAA